MKLQGFALRILPTALGLCAAFGLSACDDDGGGGDPVRFDAGVSGMGGGGGGAGGMGGGAGGTGGGGGPTDTHLRLSYVKSTLPREGEARVDMVVYDFEDDEESNLTAGTGGEVNCGAKACRLNADMSYIGWLQPAAEGGFDLWVAPVDTRRKVVRIAEKRMVSDLVISFSFTADLVVYSRGEATGPEGALEVWVEPVAGEGAGCPNPSAPATCKQRVGDINGNGSFRVTAFSSLIILLRTTLSSMTVEFFNVANGAGQEIYQFGEEGGTGSPFAGTQPIGLSPDATYIAAFTRVDFLWKLNALDAIPDPPDPATLPLFETRTNQQGDCQRPMPYNFNEVRFDPVFSDDAEFIYFLAHGDCARRASNDSPTNRDDYDILRVRRDLSGEVKNVTQNPRVSNWINHDIGNFDLSPDNAKLAFTASRPNKASSTSIWLIDPESGAYDCSRRRAEVTLDGKPRCEFIFDDSANTDFQYRDITFHEVEVAR